MKSTASHLLVRPHSDFGEYSRVTPRSAGWEHLHFAARKMRLGETWQFNTGDLECGLVVLGGICSVKSSCGKWENVGRRPDVFHGMPHALYLPPQTEFTLTAHTENFDLA